MKTYLALFSVLLCTSFHCLSQGSDYASQREWVEDWIGYKYRMPETDRIFVASSSPSEYAVIVQYRKGITLREIINQTPFQNAKLMIHVMRPNKSEDKWFQNATPLLSNKPMNEVLKTLAPLDTTDFEVKKGDVIVLIDVTPPLLI
jgi:hypothetical protein